MVRSDWRLLWCDAVLYCFGSMMGLLMRIAQITMIHYKLNVRFDAFRAVALRLLTATSTCRPQQRQGNGLPTRTIRWKLKAHARLPSSSVFKISQSLYFNVVKHVCCGLAGGAFRAVNADADAENS